MPMSKAKSGSGDEGDGGGAAVWLEGFVAWFGDVVVVAHGN